MAGEVRISVRNLVEFILRSGDIDDRRQGSPENAMQEGSRIHRMIQRRMGAEYQAEVALKYTHPTENYVIIVEGRADGIIEQNGETTIDEIKGTYRDLAKLKAPLPLHIAQAKCYAYMYSLQKELPYIRVRLTYCNIETEDIRYFYEDYEFAKLEAWFQQLIGDYRKWADYTWQWRELRQQSIAGLQDHIHHISCGEGDGEGHGRQAVLSDSQDHHPYGGGGHFFSAAGEGTAIQKYYSDSEREDLFSGTYRM